MTINEIEPAEPTPALSLEGFENLSVAGTGGMSIVYKARQVAFSRTVAVKMLHRHLVANTSSLQRFVQEGRVTTTLKHPNIARVFSYGTTEDDQPFLVMEFLEGTSLKDLIERSDGLEAGEVKRIFDGVLSGLQVAHDAGIIHRDLKPGNVMMVNDDAGTTIPKIVDFGIAKIAEASAAGAQKLTQTGAVIGSPNYMSPEQCMGTPVDARADIYAIGCMLFEALTGRGPFEADNSLAVMTMHLSSEPEPPSAVRPIPKAFDNIVLKCLQKEPNKRYSSAEALRQAIEAVDVANLTAVTTTHQRKNTKAFSSRKILMPVLVLGIVAMAGALAVMLFQHGRDDIRDWNEMQRLIDAGQPREAAAAVRHHFFSELGNAEQSSAAESEYWIHTCLAHFDPRRGYDFRKEFESQLDQSARVDARCFYELTGPKAAESDVLLAVSKAPNPLYARHYILSLCRYVGIPGPAQTKTDRASTFEEALIHATWTQRDEHIFWLKCAEAKAQRADVDKFLKLRQDITANDNDLLRKAMRTGKYEAFEGARILFEFGLYQGNPDLETAELCCTAMEEWLKERPNADPAIRARIVFQRGQLYFGQHKWKDAERVFFSALDGYKSAAYDDEEMARLEYFAGLTERELGNYAASIEPFRRALASYRSRQNWGTLVSMQIDVTDAAIKANIARHEKESDQLVQLLNRNNAEVDKVFAQDDPSSLLARKNYIFALNSVIKSHQLARDWGAVLFLAQRELELAKHLKDKELERDALVNCVDSWMQSPNSYDAAILAYETAIEIQRNLPKQDIAKLIEMEGRLASECYTAKRYSKIEPLVLDILSRSKADASLRHKYAATAPIVLGMVYAEKEGRIAEAKELFRKYKDEALSKNPNEGFAIHIKKVEDKYFNASK